MQQFLTLLNDLFDSNMIDNEIDYFEKKNKNINIITRKKQIKI